MREKIFKWIARTTYKRFIPVFIICLGLTVIFGVLSSKIRIETTWRSMLPTGHDSVKNFEKVLDWMAKNDTSEPVRDLAIALGRSFSVR